MRPLSTNPFARLAPLPLLLCLPMLSARAQDAPGRYDTTWARAMDCLDRAKAIGVVTDAKAQALFDEAAGAFESIARAIASQSPQHQADYANTHSAALYNIACSRALQGRSGEAMDALERSLAAGFSDWKLMASDPDIAMLRAQATYHTLLLRTRWAPASRRNLPKLVLEDLRTGRDASLLPKAQGRYVLVHVTNLAPSPQRLVTTVIQPLLETIRARGIELVNVGLNSVYRETQPDEARRNFAEHLSMLRLDVEGVVNLWCATRERNTDVFDLFEEKGFPILALVDPEGRVVAQGAGFTEAGVAEVLAALESVLRAAESGPGRRPVADEYAPFALGASHEQTWRTLYGDGVSPPEWSALPVAAEYGANEVRYFWVSLADLRRLPFDAALQPFREDGSYLCFLFHQRRLVRVSLRLADANPALKGSLGSIRQKLNGAPNDGAHVAVVEQTGDGFARVEWESVGAPAYAQRR